MNKEFLTVGELAGMMGITVRTLQYYDKEGLLKPSSMSEGGRRLYTAKDVVKLHQIMSFKYLGFSLKEIKTRLFQLNSPQDVAAILARQKKAIEEQICSLSQAMEAVDTLHDEVLAIQAVDFVKYADIIQMMRMGNKEFWVWKFFDAPVREHIIDRFSDDPEAGTKIFETYKEVVEESILLKNSGVSPQSEKGIKMAEKWWNMVMEFTGGDMSILPELEKFNQQKDSWNNEMAEKQKEIDEYLQAALESYFAGKNQ